MTGKDIPMKLSRPLIRCLPCVAAVVLTAAACGGDADQTAEPGAAGAASVVGTSAVDGFGTVLVDAKGKALYTNEAENDGSIKCVEACLDFWPPLEAGADPVPATVDGVDGTLGVTDRPDGKRQVTLNNQPLYTFVEDKGAGSVRGDGFEDDFQGAHFVWHVVTTSGSAPAATSEPSGGGYGY
jgi:predicted lipoprotein with Yx(FWY)xxD motif